LDQRSQQEESVGHFCLLHGLTSGIRISELALLIPEVTNRTSNNKLCPLTDGGRAECGEVKKQKLAMVARDVATGAIG
jgi:hypothetical protein